MTENLLVSLNDIEEKEASWLVPQRMPKGQIIILAGDGGSGKTSCWCSLAAAISTGAQVFFDETPKEFFESEPQKVLFFSSEDSLEYTLKARLRKAGANFNNIFSVDLKNERFSEIIRMFSDLGKQRRRGNIQSQFLWKVSGRSNLIKKPLPDWYSDRGKVTRQPCKSRVLRIISYQSFTNDHGT